MIQVDSRGFTKVEREGKRKESNGEEMVREICTIAGFQSEGRTLSCMAKAGTLDSPGELPKMN